MEHRCHAVGCKVRIPANLLLCAQHWFLVPFPLRRAVKNAYRPGQEVRKDPSQAWIDAARAAINAVAKKEGREPLPEISDIIKNLSQIIETAKAEKGDSNG